MARKTPNISSDGPSFVAPAPTPRTAGQNTKLDQPPARRQETNKTKELQSDIVPPGEVLTTNQGVGVGNDQNSLRTGVRGPTLLEDILMREKITHFDHERIPERVVHARGAAAHGFFQVYEDLSELSCAQVFRDPKVQTPVFVRFSTVAGSRGSADTPRDVRGFAVKFYTQEGIWDLVGNNMPVFFIQDANKFPDLIHAVKPEPHNEIPQAQSAHDTFWDFVSLTPESAHMLMWVMSDRALPRSFATMEGFGVHTFRLVDAEGGSRFVKFHWKPMKGVCSLVWDEAQLLCGRDPDFNRRDLFEAIERGDFPEWELGIQVVELADEHKFAFDLLDATKIIPEEQVPVRLIGKLTLNRNPDNFFAETEQVAFHTGHIVPGIDFTNDPLLQGRLFSYIDTQLRRVGPNFHELPINRSLRPVDNNQRDGLARMTINRGKVSYFPNSLGGGCPMHSPTAAAAFRSVAVQEAGAKLRERSDSFNDHFSQATQFWNSMSDWEKDHIAAAFSFELNMVVDQGVRARVMNEILCNIADELADMVSSATGIEVAPAGTSEAPTPSAPTPSGPLRPDAPGLASPALSMDKPPPLVKGRKIAIFVADGVAAEEVQAIVRTLTSAGHVPELIGPTAGAVIDAAGSPLSVNRAAPNAPSVIYDAAVIPAGARPALMAMTPIHRFLDETFRHGKPISVAVDAAPLLDVIGVAEGPGVTVGEGSSIPASLVENLAHHRFPRRVSNLTPS
ncbi:catalase [Reyranella sp.]|uniref:catalase n=1 Tax=Reyranella sp. TaxID=1929291 RepID=UPI0012107687|nr:catalase [Reyranella sp.]TAJ83073.1 MAG: catalase [Reyranella sp.]